MPEEDDLDKIVKSVLVNYALDYLSLPKNEAKARIDNKAKNAINNWTNDEIERQKLYHFYESIKNPRYLKTYREHKE